MALVGWDQPLVLPYCLEKYMNEAHLCDDTRWPISIDTEAGRVFLTKAEAEALLHSLQTCLAELDQLKQE